MRNSGGIGAGDHPPAQWPDSAVRDRVLQLIEETPLSPLFELQQARAVRQLRQGERLVAEWSLDDVRVIAGGREQAYCELEVELTLAGTEGDVAAIVDCLQNEWGPEPEPRSKFERALAFAGVASPEGGLLTFHERAICEQVATQDVCSN